MYCISNYRSSQNHNPYKSKREWKISHFKPAFEPKAGDYPLSF